MDTKGRIGLALMSLALLISAFGSEPSPAKTPRVALMNLTTDDNSYRNAQAAADFTSLLQIRLADASGLEWVERAQIDLARKELGLSAMDLVAGTSAMRWGRWAQADWLVTGRFSSDDRNRRILFVEITDLQHADVLTNANLVLPGDPFAPLAADPDLLTLATEGVQRVLASARKVQARNRQAVLVAPLYFANLTGRFGPSFGLEELPAEFAASIEQAAARKGGLRVVRFPRAYQAMEESGLMAEGLVDAGQAGWQPSADLYVWGTCEATNVPGTLGNKGRLDRRLKIEFHAWDGATDPVVFGETLQYPMTPSVPVEKLASALNSLADRVIGLARKQKLPADSSFVRHQIADAIVQTHKQSTGPGWASDFPDRAGKFAQTVQMLETACWLDPNNAEAQALRISCRYGWWINFGTSVKNQFWAKWRRSQAWGRYVERFGLATPRVGLPFPDHNSGVAGIYVGSLADVVRMCPDDFRWPENETYSGVRQAQLYGFPKDISNATAAAWKAELEAELALRAKRVDEYKRLNPPPTNPVAVVPPVIPPAFSGPPKTFSSRPGSSPNGKSTNTIPVPAWMKELRPGERMFQLSLPSVMPPPFEPPKQTFLFPRQYEVSAVIQMAFVNGNLLILATDKRSVQSSDPNPGLEVDRLQDHCRLWSLDPADSHPQLLVPEIMPPSVNGILVRGDHLWVAGEPTGWLDLQNHQFHTVGLNEGLPGKNVEVLASAGADLFAAGAGFKLSQLESGAAQWRTLDLPHAQLSHGTGNPYVLAGHGDWLAYSAGATLFYNCARRSWTNALVERVRCAAPDADGFWLGGALGLHFVKPAEMKVESWMEPRSTVAGAQMIFTDMSYPSYGKGGARILQSDMEMADTQIRRCLEKFQKAHAQAAATRTNQSALTRPFTLDYRMGSEVTALAHDGDFLWVGFGRFGSTLLLLHKPSRSIVGACAIASRIASLAVSDRDVWVGTEYGTNLLTRIAKADFLARPRGNWMSLVIPPEEQQRLIQALSRPNRAKYAFYSNDDEGVVKLLGNVDPNQMTLEEMLLVGFSYSIPAVNRSDQACRWFEQIAAHHPDSPWARFAQDQLVENQQRIKFASLQAASLEKFDRNKDGKLDERETLTMQADPEYRREKLNVNAEQLTLQLKPVIKRYDRSEDGKLDATELGLVKSAVKTQLEAEKAGITRRSNPVAPLMTSRFPSVDDILSKHDRDKDGSLSLDELQSLAQEIQDGIAPKR